MTVDTDTKACPDCAEEIKAAARVCRFCGYRFDTPAPTDEAPANLGAESPGSDHEREPAMSRPRDWRRIGAYVVSIALWLLSAPPLAVQLYEDRSTEDIVASWIAAPITSLVLAGLLRVPYILVRKRPLLSPWLFVVAAVLSILSAAGA